MQPYGAFWKYRWCLKAVNFFVKNSIIDAWQSLKYALLITKKVFNLKDYAGVVTIFSVSWLVRRASSMKVP